MPQKHDSEGSGPQWRIAETDGKGFRAGSGEGYITNNVDSTVDMEIAIGEQDFHEIISKGSFYADKSLLIRDLIRNRARALLITRPRRSGKSLGLSMIDRFFNVKYAKKEAKKDSFAGLKVSQLPEYPKYVAEFKNRYPVIKLNASDFSGVDLEDFKKRLHNEVLKTARREFKYLKTSEVLDEDDRSEAIGTLNGEWDEPGDIVESLCYLLEAHHGNKPIILIDECDTPLTTIYGKPYFDDLAKIYGKFLEKIVKSNEHASFIILTGVQKVVTAGMASGLNNIYHCGVLSREFAEHFGLTPDEVEDAIRRQVDDLFPDWSEEQRRGYADRKFAEAKEWYDGYRIGGYDIYNPWSVTNFIRNDIVHDDPPSPYWDGTSRNGILVEVLSGFGEATLNRIKDLYQSKDVPEFDRITPNSIVWNGKRFTETDVAPLLLSHGYLTAESAGDRMRVRIPNTEVRFAYDDLMRYAYCLSIPDVIDLIKHITQKNPELVKKDLETLMSGGATIDGWDESRYRMWMRQVFQLNGYRSIAEQPSGNGFIDMLVKEHAQNPPLLFEFKVLKPEDNTDLSKAVGKGTDQIVKKNYADEYQLPGVIPLAVAFRQKSCEVRFL